MIDKLGACLAVVSARVSELGFDGINPESLEALGDSVRAEKESRYVRSAYYRVMAGFRELFAPVVH